MHYVVTGFLVQYLYCMYPSFSAIFGIMRFWLLSQNIGFCFWSNWKLGALALYTNALLSTCFLKKNLFIFITTYPSKLELDIYIA